MDGDKLILEAACINIKDYNFFVFEDDFFSWSIWVKTIPSL
jgi:hypothetical protein